MIVFIVPAFAKVYDQFNAPLPAVTQSLIFLSDLILHRAWIVILILLGGLIVFVAVGCNEDPIVQVAPSIEAAGGHAIASLERAIAPTKDAAPTKAAEVERHIAETQHWEFEC